MFSNEHSKNDLGALYTLHFKVQFRSFCGAEAKDHMSWPATAKTTRNACRLANQLLIKTP